MLILISFKISKRIIYFIHFISKDMYDLRLLAVRLAESRKRRRMLLRFAKLRDLM